MPQVRRVPKGGTIGYEQIAVQEICNGWKVVNRLAPQLREAVYLEDRIVYFDTRYASANVSYVVNEVEKTIIFEMSESKQAEPTRRYTERVAYDRQPKALTIHTTPPVYDMPPPIREGQTKGIPIEVKKSPRLNEAEQQQVGIMLARTLGSALDKYEVVETFGRVYMLRYVPLRKADPMLPFVFGDYGLWSNWWLKRNYRTLTDMIITHINHKYNIYYSGWNYKKADSAAWGIVRTIVSKAPLSAEEKNYFRTKLLHVAAYPRGQRI